MTNKPLSYRPEIDVLRAWAVIIVVLYHLDLPLFSGGFIGVDVFFVISGYLITRNIRVALEKDKFSLTQFYARRARRLMPSLLVTLMASLALGSYLMASSHFLALAKNTFGAVLSISNIFFWKQTSYFDDALKLNPMMHTWSLSLEEQFYLLYPLLLIGLTKASKTRRHLAWSLGLATLASFIFSIWATQYRSAFAFYMVPARLWEFTIGGLVWCLEDLKVQKSELQSHELLSDQIQIKPKLTTLLTPYLTLGLHLLSFLLIAYACAYLNEHDEFPGLLALTPCLAASLFIYIAPQEHFLNRLYLNQIWVKLGQMSYAIYLTHWPIITFYRHYHFNIKLSLSTQLQVVILTLISAYALHILIEQPLRKRLVLWKNFKMIPALLLAVICLASLSLYSWKSPNSSANAQASSILSKHGLDPKLALKDFKRSTYGGQGCQPPRCSTQYKEQATNQSAKKPKIDAFVIGDSYALALFQGIKKYFPQQNIIFWERGACEFYSLSYVGNKNKGQNKCVQSKKDAFTELAQNPNIPVILGQHWHSNYEEKMLLWPSHPSTVSKQKNQALAITYHSIDEYAQFVAKELKQLKKQLGLNKLTIIGGPPKFAAVFSPLDCLLSPLHPRPCEYSPKDDFTLWHYSFQKALMKHIQGEFKVLSLYPALCDAQNCQNFDREGHLIYSDYGHLSKWGAQAVVHQLKTEFQDALSSQ